jgi:hypothetical protein
MPEARKRADQAGCGQESAHEAGEIVQEEGPNPWPVHPAGPEEDDGQHCDQNDRLAVLRSPAGGNGEKNPVGRGEEVGGGEPMKKIPLVRRGLRGRARLGKKCQGRLVRHQK